MGAFDVVIEGGLVFDGRGSSPSVANVGIKDGAVVEISPAPLSSEGAQRVDARGKWVTPGFIDVHTHYDAEVELAPSLSESVRHGVTTVTLGSCSLSLAVGTPEDLADMFCRVEAIPYEIVRPLLERNKSWSSQPEYLEHLGALPLGPNVASFMGHSAIRAHVMGLERSLQRVKPTEEELSKMEALVREGLDAGFLGMSVMALKWDKIGGSRHIRSRPLPSTFARWSEYRRLTDILRERDRVFQAVPNFTTKVDIFLFMLESCGWGRKPLKTTVLSMMDTRANPGIWAFAGLMGRLTNTFLKGDLRWQALPEVFDLWADGIDLVVFEEFGAGAAALHLQDGMERAKLLKDDAYREQFKEEWKSAFLPKVFHRDFNRSEILDCPDKSLVGKSFVQIGMERRMEPVDVFLDLVAKYGPQLRWYTVMANDQESPLRKIVSHPDILIGFSDAGAHLRNMAHYNFPLRLLRLVREAEKAGKPFMPVEKAVFRLTSEIAQWIGIDAGVLEKGARADVCVLDPEGLTDAVDQATEAEMEGFNGFRRLVRRNDQAMNAVLINGRFAVRDGVVQRALGAERGFGKVLRAGATVPKDSKPVPRAA